MQNRPNPQDRANALYAPGAGVVPHSMRRIRAALALAGAVVGVLGAAGCTGNSGVERDLDRAGVGISQVFDGARSEERTFTLPVDGVIDIDVQTFGGSVVIRGGRPTQGQARILVDVVARHGRERTEAGDASLKEVDVKAEIKRGGDVPTLVVRAETKSEESWLQRTDIDITLPEVRRVRVKTRGGKVYVYENRGGVTVETSDGEIRVLTPWAITEDVTLVTKGQDIIFRAFVGTCGSVDVDCVNGEVAARVEAGDWRILDRRNDRDTLIATMGTCNNRIFMRNVDARVLISIVKNPMEHGTFFSSP